MKASYLWLCELVRRGIASGGGSAHFEASPREIAAKLTGAGFEVEGLDRYGAACEHVVVARVLAKEPHPTRAKLSLVTVELSGARTQRVVCGASNVPEPGGLVVLAPLGTHLPAKGLTLEPREIAGVMSEGMLCSEDELGIRGPVSIDGILVLPAGLAEPGTKLSEAIPESCDHILDISLTPNRPDGLGHLGLAREIAALFGLAWTEPTSAALPAHAGVPRVVDVLDVRIDDTSRCPTYGAALVSGAHVRPSPNGVAYRLDALGVRSINNVVDVTNLVMLELGHPIHAFDLKTVRKDPKTDKPAIIVRAASAGETMLTLDGVTRTFVTDDLVIADGAGPVAIAGVMGGELSGVAADTETVLIECAYFEPRGVRRTSRRHGMHTESSHRFERGVDPGDTAKVLARAASLLVELAGGHASPELHIVGPGVAKHVPVELRRARMRGLLGLDLSLDEAKTTLRRLGCEVVSEDPARESVSFAVPTHRPDLKLEVDLIEEVVRVHGIDDVQPVVPAVRAEAPRGYSDVPARIARAAIGVGLSQALTFGFTSPRVLEAIGAPKSHLVLKNPLTDDRTVMRTTLLPGLLEAVSRARRHGVSDARLFAVGARFLPPAANSDSELPLEVPSFAAVLAGERDAVLEKRQPIDVWDAKGVAVAVIERAVNRKVTVRRHEGDTRPQHLHPRSAGELLVEGQVVGSFGMLHPLVDRALEVGGPVAVVEIDLEALNRVGAALPRYRPIPTLPASSRDIAVVVADAVQAGDVQRAIRDVAGELCESVELFDLYRGQNVPAGHRSLAFHVVYRDPKAATDPERARTLTDAEVDQRHGAVQKEIGSRFGAQLRA
ncbi:MAG: phenylalanine--tRNA ligase subunit beta [Polyangiaceae bacterium]